MIFGGILPLALPTPPEGTLDGVGGFMPAQNQKQLIIWTVYVVNSMCTDF